MTSDIQENSSGISCHEQLFNKKIWKIHEVSNYTGFSIRTIYNKTSKNEIPHRKRGGRLFFMPDEIQNWIEEGE